MAFQEDVELYLVEMEEDIDLEGLECKEVDLEIKDEERELAQGEDMPLACVCGGEGPYKLGEDNPPRGERPAPRRRACHRVSRSRSRSRSPLLDISTDASGVFAGEDGRVVVFDAAGEPAGDIYDDGALFDPLDVKVLFEVDDEDAVVADAIGGEAATRQVSAVDVPLVLSDSPVIPEVMSENAGERGRPRIRMGARVRGAVRGRGKRGVRGRRGASGVRGGRVANGTRGDLLAEQAGPGRRGLSHRAQQWTNGEPLQEVFKRDGDLDLRVLALVDEDERKRQARVRANRARSTAERKESAEAQDVDSSENSDSEGDSDGEDEESGEIFEWFPSETFRAQHEAFLVERTGSVVVHDSPYSAFRALWPDSALELVVTQTNLYAAQLGRVNATFARMWYDTNADEIMCLFAFWMLMAIIRMPTVTDYFSTDPLMEHKSFRKLFTRDRFVTLCRALHFVDTTPAAQKNTDLPNPELAAASDRLHRLRPIIDILNETFKSSYVLDRDICIDESLTLWKGRLNFKQYIRSKAAKFGIKSFELCESKTGYLWSFRYYTGKLPTLDTLPPGYSKSTGIVMELMTPLLQKGHQLFMDNWYNTPALARWLKRNKTDCVGTLRLSSADVPLLFSRVTLRQGQFIARHSGDVCLMSWQDKKRITTLSTYHGAHQALPRVSSRPPNRPLLFKPQVVLDYNRSMGGVDVKDQMLEPYALERKKGKKWYMKLFKRLINSAVLNSRILYASSHPKSSHTPVQRSHLAFRKQLAREIMNKHLTNSNRRQDRSSQPVPPNPILDGHWVEIRPNRARCYVCYHKHRQTRLMKWQCSKCKVPLCIDCFPTYHSDPDFTITT